MATALFLNRQIKRDSLQKVYVINYMPGLEQTRENLLPYDIAAKKISIDHKLSRKLFQPGLKQNDTVVLKFNRGIFGIAFQSELPGDK